MKKYLSVIAGVIFLLTSAGYAVYSHFHGTYLIKTLTEQNQTLKNQLQESQKQTDDLQKQVVMLANRAEEFKHIAAKLYAEADYLVDMDVEYTLAGIKAHGVLAGFVIKLDNKFFVLTAGHIVDKIWKITNITVFFKNGGRPQEAELVAADEIVDAALLKFKDENFVFNGRTAKLGSSADLKIGDWVIALGSPLELSYTLSIGVVMNLLDNVEGVITKRFGMVDYRSKQPTLIMQSAIINPGNSGGPLINLEGEIVGINVFLLGDDKDPIITPLPFATPIDYVKQALPMLKTGQVKNYATLRGLDIVDSPNGILVVHIDNESPAAQSGLKPADIIVAVNGHRFRKRAELYEYIMFETDPGTKIEITVKRYAIAAEETKAIKITVEPLN